MVETVLQIASWIDSNIPDEAKPINKLLELFIEHFTEYLLYRVTIEAQFSEELVFHGRMRFQMERTQRVQKWGKTWFVLRNISERFKLQSTHKQVKGGESGG